MTPIGPFISQFTDLAVFIVKDAVGNIVTVSEGFQPSEGTKHQNLRDAKIYLNENGFLQKN